MTAKHITIGILGLSCGGGGVTAIEHALSRLPGVRRAYVNPLTEMAYVEYEPERTTVEQLVAAVERAGFPVSMTVAR